MSRAKFKLGQIPASGRRLCVVCGARVINHNPRTVTCDEVCTAAKKAGRTRVEQIAWEMQQPVEQSPTCAGCGFFTSQCQCWDSVNGIN